MLFKLFLLFTVIPTVEIIILMQLGVVFGIAPTLILVIGTGLLGAYLAKREGIKILFKIQEETRAGRMPARHMIDGLLILIAGVVLITPGLLTDIAGFIFLFPLTRHAFVDFILRNIKNHMDRGSYTNVEYHIQE